MRDAEVPVESRRFEGLIHGAYTFSALIPRAAEIHEEIVRFLAARLSGAPEMVGAQTEGTHG